MTRAALFRTPYVQGTADLITRDGLERAQHKFRVLQLELEPHGWRSLFILHDEIEWRGPSSTREQAHEIISRHTMSGERTRWCFELADGTRVSGCVQGCGGIVEYTGGRERLEIARRHAIEGDNIRLYEPEPGHVRVYPSYGPMGQGEPLDVDLRTARLL